MTARALKPAGKQRGTLIVALMAGIAITMILSTVAVQNWGDVVRRDNEAEMMFRAEDIVRALKRYQTDKGKLPTELKELMEPGNKGQYFLRRLWKDPLVKGGQWQLVYAAPGGGLFDPTVGPPPGAEGGLPGGLGASGGMGAAGGLGGSQINPNEAGGIPSLDQRNAKAAGAGDPAGFPIAGVKTRCTEKPFRKYKEKTEYSEWIFSIFDLEQQRQPGKGAAGQPGATPSNATTFPPTQQPPPGQTP